MDHASSASRLVGLAAGILICLMFALVPEPGPARRVAPGTLRDMDVFERIVDRVRAGESFHDASQRILRAQHYPTRSPFNWRTPTYAWWLASPIGTAFGRWGLVLGMFVVCLIAGLGMLEKQGLVGASLGVVFLVGSMAWSFGDKGWYLTELWAAMLLVLAILAADRGHWRLGVAAGLLALFFRELALPYAIVSLSLAIAARRRPEAIAWVLGLIAYGLFFAWHSSCVYARLSASDLAFKEGWIQFGGLPFALQTARANVFLAPFPLWCVAVYLPTALFGMAADRGETGRRLALTVGAYVASFGVVGHPMNFYWGLVYAPMLALGIARAPRALGHAIAVAWDGPGPSRVGDSGRRDLEPTRGWGRIEDTSRCPPL